MLTKILCNVRKLLKALPNLILDEEVSLLEGGQKEKVQYLYHGRI